MHSIDAEQSRRLTPRIFDSDWLVLRRLHAAIVAQAAKLTRPSATAVDFGCGAQPYASIFRSAGMTYRGADFGTSAELAITDDGLLQAEDDSADLVLSFQVLEHVRDLPRYFSEARRVLRDGGQMMLSTHGTWLYHPHPGDYRRWTRSGLVTDIEANGFEVTDCMPVVGPLAWTTVMRLTCFCFALRKIPALGGVIAAMLAAVMNVRAVIEDAVTPAWVTNDNACVYLMICRPRP
ncbi:MAG: class I SAM-dependent methyltransferase [Caulobacteraceae bacterium]